MFKAVMAELTYWRKCDQVRWLVFKSDSLLQENEGMFSQKVWSSDSKVEFAIDLLRVLWPILQALEKI